MPNYSLFDDLRNIANQYPVDLIYQQVLDIPRIAFHINTVIDTVKPKDYKELELCDIGGGIGLFSVGCAAFGVNRTVLIDDFSDSINQQVGPSILNLHRSFGVEVITRNVIENGIRDIEGTFDVITTFESMEHWHHSPKRLFHDVIEKLKPGGVFILSGPNCVNLRKRMTLPLGIGKWSRMQEWYEVEIFRGHVREPDVSDLTYIARDMGLVDIKIFGRNWLGYSSANSAVRFFTRIVDYPLRLKPSFCSNIYMIGKKSC